METRLIFLLFLVQWRGSSSSAVASPGTKPIPPPPPSQVVTAPPPPPPSPPPPAVDPTSLPAEGKLDIYSCELFAKKLLQKATMHAHLYILLCGQLDF